MSLLQVSSTSLIHKKGNRLPLKGKLFIEFFHCRFMLNKKLFGKNMQDPGRSDHFPEGTECLPLFCKLYMFM